MAITVESISVNWFSNTSPPYDLDIPLPSGVQSGDLMIMLSFYGHNSNNTMATPSGWTLLDQNRTHGTGVGARYIHYRVSDGADTDPVVNNWNNFTGGTGGIIINLRGVDTDSIPDASVYNNQGTDAAPTCSSATPSGSNAIALAIWCGDDNDLTTDTGYPSGWTGIFMEDTASGQDIMAGAAYKIVSAASGDAAFTIDASEQWIGDMLVFAEASGAAAHTITGDVTVTQTIAAAMVEGRVIAGDVTVAQTIAALMEEGRTIAGDVTVDQTIAAAMTFALGHVIAGDVTVTQTIAAVMLEGRVIAGDVTVAQTIAAAMEFAGEAAIVGDVTVAQTIAALMEEGRVISGDVTVDQTIAALMEEGRTIAGDVTVTQAIAAGMIFGIAYDIAGAITVAQTIAADMLEGRAIVGDVTVAQTIQALMIEGRVIAGDVTVNQAIAAAMVYAAAGAAEIVGDVTVTQTIAALMLEGRVIAGDITVDQAIAAAMVYAAAPSGDCITPTTILEGSLTWEEAMRIILAAAAGESSGLPTAPKYRDQADTKDRIDAVTDGQGNRSSVTVDGS